MFSYYLLEDSASLSKYMIELINKSLFSCYLMREWAPTLSPSDQSSTNYYCLHRSFFALYVIYDMEEKIAHNCVHEKKRDNNIHYMLLDRLCSCRQWWYDKWIRLDLNVLVIVLVLTRLVCLHSHVWHRINRRDDKSKSKSKAINNLRQQIESVKKDNKILNNLSRNFMWCIVTAKSQQENS